MHVSAQGMEPVQYDAFLKSKTLKQFSVGFGSMKKNNELLARASRIGIQPFRGDQFSFV
jgi:hypothetical protein